MENGYCILSIHMGRKTEMLFLTLISQRLATNPLKWGEYTLVKNLLKLESV